MASSSEMFIKKSINFLAFFFFFFFFFVFLFFKKIFLKPGFKYPFGLPNTLDHLASLAAS